MVLCNFVSFIPFHTQKHHPFRWKTSIFQFHKLRVIEEIFTHTHVRAHTHTHTHACTHTHMHANTHVRTHTHTRTQTQVGTHTHTCTHAHTYTHTSERLAILTQSWQRLVPLWSVLRYKATVTGSLSLHRSMPTLGPHSSPTLTDSLSLHHSMPIVSLFSAHCDWLTIYIILCPLRLHIPSPL